MLIGIGAFTNYATSSGSFANVAISGTFISVFEIAFRKILISVFQLAGECREIVRIRCFHAVPKTKHNVEIFRQISVFSDPVVDDFIHFRICPKNEIGIFRCNCYHFRKIFRVLNVSGDMPPKVLIFAAVFAFLPNVGKVFSPVVVRKYAIFCPCWKNCIRVKKYRLNVIAVLKASAAITAVRFRHCRHIQNMSDFSIATAYASVKRFGVVSLAEFFDCVFTDFIKLFKGLGRVRL